MEDLKTAIEKHGFSILAIIDMQKKFQSIGKNSLPTSIIQLCNPEMAYHAVCIDRHLVCMMPKDINICENEDGSVSVGFIRSDPGSLDKAFPGKNITEMSSKMAAILIQIIEDAV